MVRVLQTGATSTSRTAVRRRKKQRSNLVQKLLILVAVGVLIALCFAFAYITTTPPTMPSSSSGGGGGVRMISDASSSSSSSVLELKKKPEALSNGLQSLAENANAVLPSSSQLQAPTRTAEKDETAASATQQQQHERTAEATPYYKYVYREFKVKGNEPPWTDWSKCNPQDAFEQYCHPRPAICTNVQEDLLNNHGIGNALMVTYVQAAFMALQKQPNCAPILKDKPMKPNSVYNFRLLDYVQEPTVVVNVTDMIPRYQEQAKKCVAYAITQPRQAVQAKVLELASKWSSSDAHQKLPLVAIHLRTGWSDELNKRAHAWEALGDCDDYRDQFPIDMAPPHGMTAVDLKGILLDTAHAADHAFGKQRWRLYVASDAPGIRTYVRHILQSRVTGPIVWNEGLVGHNYLGGLTTTLQQKIETSVNAFTDVIVMSNADMLVNLYSKFPGAAKLRSMCPQRSVQIATHPRHGLAKSGDALNEAWKNVVDKPSAHKDGRTWSPQLADDKKSAFFGNLPDGANNPCTSSGDDPVRACFCMLKLSHA